jgi:hypothetical protein
MNTYATPPVLSGLVSTNPAVCGGLVEELPRMMTSCINAALK